MSNDDELQRLRQENHNLREELKQALLAIDFLQERVKELERQQAKDSHNSSLPPSSDRFVRPPKSLRQSSGKKAGGQKGHQGHHLQQVEAPDEILIHAVERCEVCQQDVSEQAAEYPQHRQVMDLPPLRLWVREHRVQEKCCPICLHRTRAAFPIEVSAPAQYGTGIQALAGARASRPLWACQPTLARSARGPALGRQYCYLCGCHFSGKLAHFSQIICRRLA